MAIVARIRVEGAGSEEHGRLQRAVEERLAAVGAPPDGLMVHLGYPDGDALVIVEAWRTEDRFRTYLREVLGPALEEVGFVAGAPEIGPAWSIARP